MAEKSTFTGKPGMVALFGSGETTPAGRKVFECLLRQIPLAPNVALLETPAGFELNSERVVGKIADFIVQRLQNYQPQTVLVPARKRGTSFSPDLEEIARPITTADLIFLGPGSPTYAIRQLSNSLAWHTLLARHRLGAHLALASAAVIACSAYALPVYEIYKVGEDLHWKEGLDFFRAYGLNLVFVPHWNNQDGGEELDTSRCFMGKTRFSALMDLLPEDLTVVGIDEKTALVLDLVKGACRVVGQGGVTLLHTGHRHRTRSQDSPDKYLAEIARQRNSHVHQYVSGEKFRLSELGSFQLPPAGDGLRPEVLERVLLAQQSLHEQAQKNRVEEAPPAVLDLMAERQAARQRKDWTAADQIRGRMIELGWQVLDTPEGPKLEKR